MIASTSYRDVWSFRRHPCRHHVFHNRDHCNALGGWWFLNRRFIDENPSISGKLWDFLPRYKRHDSSVLAGGSCDITVIWIRIHVSGIRYTYMWGLIWCTYIRTLPFKRIPNTWSLGFSMCQRAVELWTNLLQVCGPQSFSGIPGIQKQRKLHLALPEAPWIPNDNGKFPLI